MTAPIRNRSDARRYMTSGRNVVFTLKSRKTGTYCTFRMRPASGNRALFFVDALLGPDNTDDFRFIGSVRDGAYRQSAKGALGDDHTYIRALEYLMMLLRNDGPFPDTFEFWHSGKCSRCGRRLTTPESVETGMGPVGRARSMES